MKIIKENKFKIIIYLLVAVMVIAFVAFFASSNRPLERNATIVKYEDNSIEIELDRVGLTRVDLHNITVVDLDNKEVVLGEDYVDKGIYIYYRNVQETSPATLTGLIRIVVL